MVEFLNEYVFGVAVPIFLIISGVFYCIKLRFFHFLHPVKLIKCLTEKERGQTVSSAKALSLALAGTLGVGNMVGVASAIALGGPGAVFWMWVSALLAMVLKYAEIVLAIRHRQFDPDGTPHGSAMNYICDCFGRGRLGVLLAGVFALLCILNSVSMGSMIQARAASEACRGVFGFLPIAVGAVFAVFAAVALLRGRSGVLGFTEKLVPFMTVGFVVLSVAALLIRPESTGQAFLLIFRSAFSVKSGVGGVAGFLLSGALRYGSMRGILSNEAGCGTSPAAHSAADCKVGAKQGVWGILEVFVDTILLCTLTALVILAGGATEEGKDYMMITVEGYTSILGEWSGYFIAAAVAFFGLATVLCWGYYGMESVRYLSPKKGFKYAFVAVYCLSVLFSTVISEKIIWETADFAIGSMTVINLAVLLFMSGEVKKETVEYFKLSGRAGKGKHIPDDI